MAEKSNVHEGHRQRLRQRAITEGLDAFNPHQVMELLLFYALPRQDVSEIAHALINRFGTVRRTLHAPKEELMQVKGIGTRAAEWLLCLGELIDAYSDLRDSDRPRIRNFQMASIFCEAQRRKVHPPETYCIFLTPSGVIQLFGKIADSNAWSEPESLRKSLQMASSLRARNIIVVIYTQTAVPQIEEYDCVKAKEYMYSLHIMGVELMDVIWVGEQEIVSMIRSGKLERINDDRIHSTLKEGYLKEETIQPEDLWFVEE